MVIKLQEINERISNQRDNIEGKIANAVSFKDKVTMVENQVEQILNITLDTKKELFDKLGTMRIERLAHEQDLIN